MNTGMVGAAGPLRGNSAEEPEKAQIKDLMNQGFSFGLVKALNSNREAFPWPLVMFVHLH